jgi:hypothetical protein
LLVLTICFSSCQKEPTTTKSESNPSPLSAKGTVAPPETEQRCDCEYQVVSVSYSPSLPANHMFTYNVSTDETCVNNVNCRYFSVSEACDLGNDPICTDLLAANAVKPTAWEKFNCTVQYYSTFFPKVEYPFFINPNCTVPNNTKPSGTITLRVRCKVPATEFCSEEYQVSENISCPFTNGVGASPFAQIDLEGCGCTPAVSYVQ